MEENYGREENKMEADGDGKERERARGKMVLVTNRRIWI